MIGRFLGGIGALIRRVDDGRYLLLRRSSDKDYGANNWECVTGRVDQGEGFETALKREVREEIGVDVEIDFIIGTSHFYRGEAIPENELIGVIYACTIVNPDEIVVSAEHSKSQWMTAEEVFTFLEPESWLYGVIERAEFLYQHLPDSVREYHQQNGYETS